MWPNSLHYQPRCRRVAAGGSAQDSQVGRPKLKPVIAIVDDDPRVLESIEELLESAGHTARTFLSAEALLNSQSLAEIDCLITDIGMPGLGGFELRQLMSERCPGVM